MSKISCNLTRDLFTVYLDEICSDESRELVEEHLQECEECKQLLGRMKGKDTKECIQNEQVQFFAKAKKYIDNRYKLVFIIALLFAGVVGIYSDIYYGYVPEGVIYVSIPILMCTFFLAQPVKQCKEKKYHLLQTASVLSGVLLIGLQFFVIQQLNILLTFPDDAGLYTIFKWNPMDIGPFLDKTYLCFIVVEIILIILYCIIGQKKKYHFILGQNASWTGIGLGLLFQASLHRMDTPEGFSKGNIAHIRTLLVEFLIVLLLNMIYVRWRRNMVRIR